MGKMTGVSDLSQKRPSRVVNRLSWMSSIGGRRAMVSVLEARRLVLQRGQYLEYCQPSAERVPEGKMKRTRRSPFPSLRP